MYSETYSEPKPAERSPRFDDQSLQPDTQSVQGGRLRAKIVVVGSFCALTGGLGFMNSIGVYQAWLAEHQLRHIKEGQRGWIFGLYNFMVFFCGIQIGPAFDSYGPTWLMCAALLLYIVAFAALGFCSAYWHFLIVIGLVAGAATSILFVVPVATIGQYYVERRGTATGLAMAGGSLGGVVFPLVFKFAGAPLDFAWTTRIIGLITVVLVMAGCFTVRSPSHRKKSRTSQAALPDLGILLDRQIALLTIGVFFIEWGFFVGLEYVASYSIQYGIDRQLSYLMIVFLNAGSFPGRWLPGILADFFGRMNTLIAATALCATCMFGIWLPAEGRPAVTIVFAVVFGFASGSNISLVPVCVGEYCPIDNYGKYYTTVYTVVSFGALTGVPIASQIIEVSRGSYSGLIIFAGISYVAGLLSFIGVRCMNR